MDGYHRTFEPGEYGFGNLQVIQEALENSSFAMTGNRDASGGSMAVWGQAAHSVFAGREDELTLDGKVRSGIVGGRLRKRRMDRRNRGIFKQCQRRL